ncbi:MAG: class I SAM-dependent RNA methyltransferase [Eubacterium sp.]|nr:class I SAM-dependent RNA methyltransferase [Eubacterium sp.]
MSRKNKKKIPDGPEAPFCPHFEECGGCTYQRFTYEGQKAEKLNKVQRLVAEVCPDFPLYECLDSPRQTGYRNKMEFSFGDQEKDGPLTLGLHQRGSFYNVVPIFDCQIVDSDYRSILWACMQFFRELGIPYVHKRSHEGVLRHLVIRKSVATGEIMVVLVTSSQRLSTYPGKCSGVEETDSLGPGDYPGEQIGVEVTSGSSVGSSEAGTDISDVSMIPDWEFSWISDLVERLTLLDLYGRITGIIHVINDSLADVVKSDRTVLLYGRDWIEERLLGLSFKITPFSFFQTNSTGAEVLYSVVRDYIGDLSGKTVYDLYSGTGTIAQMLAKVAKRVVGVEIVEEAVEAARENAALNGLTNCEFIAGDVLQVLDDLTEPPDVMVLDPPREGIHPKALPRLLSYGVDYFVYVSCKPDSLARDLGPILAAGYKPVKAVCVDMFPWTKHVETCALLSKTSVSAV